MNIITMTGVEWKNNESKLFQLPLTMKMKDLVIHRMVKKTMT
jgi:hypothetical protein